MPSQITWLSPSPTFDRWTKIIMGLATGIALGGALYLGNKFWFIGLGLVFTHCGIMGLAWIIIRDLLGSKIGTDGRLIYVQKEDGVLESAEPRQVKAHRKVLVIDQVPVVFRNDLMYVFPKDDFATHIQPLLKDAAQSYTAQAAYLRFMMRLYWRHKAVTLIWLAVICVGMTTAAAPVFLTLLSGKPA